MHGEELPKVRHYFVDEAGDPTLFNAKGRLIIGSDGCSTHFLVGVLEVSQPQKLEEEINQLRAALLADPFFKKVPSMQARARKTALLFHAKDDVPEVRREMFNLLARHSLRFYAVVRDKQAIARMVLERNKRSATYRYHPNQLYDNQIRRLFKDRLHKAESIRVCFARRGASDRTDALRKALEAARDDFRDKWGIDNARPIEVTAEHSARSASLQAADYFLWSLHRVYTRGEDRYLEFLYPAIGLVHDVDDVREKPYGVYYTQQNVLTAERVRKMPGI